MDDMFEIEVQGDHQYLIHPRGAEDASEILFRVTPSALEALGSSAAEEEMVVRQTLNFLAEHQALEDFPPLIELEDVIAAYDGYAEAITRGSRD